MADAWLAGRSGLLSGISVRRAHPCIGTASATTGQRQRSRRDSSTNSHGLRAYAYWGNCSGEIRMAAPVGHARTQAAPPLMSLHISHFTAFFS